MLIEYRNILGDECRINITKTVGRDKEKRILFVHEQKYHKEVYNWDIETTRIIAKALLEATDLYAVLNDGMP
jgi:hypothetical protein